jgi:hypothetical protein
MGDPGRPSRNQIVEGLASVFLGPSDHLKEAGVDGGYPAVRVFGDDGLMTAGENGPKERLCLFWL